jgi:uncharacterized membrane protein YkvA (DUF1232 family)
MAFNITEEETSSALNAKKREAEKLLKDEKKTNELLRKAQGLLSKIKKLPVIGGLVDDIITTIALIGDYVNGNYREIPGGIIVSALAAMIYFVSPIDLIPDVIPIVGFLDDAAVLMLALKMGLSPELKKYLEAQAMKKIEAAEINAEKDWEGEETITSFK